MTETKIFVADEVSDSGLQPLRDAGFVVEKQTGLKAEELATSRRLSGSWYAGNESTAKNEQRPLCA